jgi:hypothetical protein
MGEQVVKWPMHSATRRLVVLATGLVVIGTSAVAPGDMARRGRAFVDADILYWQGTLGDPRSTTQAVFTTQTVGLLGYRRVPFGLGLAYALSERWVLGARLDVAVEPGPARADPVTVRGGIGPFAELTFLRDRHVRPFAIVRASVGRSHAFAGSNDVTIPSTDAVTFYPTLGAGLGTHVFLADTVSFDAMLMLDHRWNFARPRTGPNADAGQAPTDVTITDDAIVADGWRYRDGTLGTALTFGISHWW